MNAVGHIISHKHKGEGMEEKVVVEFINDMKQERKSDKFYIHFCRLPRLLTQQGLTTIERVDDAG